MSTTNKHQQNGSIDHAFGLTTPPLSKHNHMNFNFEDNFTEFNHTDTSDAIIPNGINSNMNSKTKTSANRTVMNNDDSYETITIVGDSKITKNNNSISNSSLTEKKYIMNNYDSISYASTSKQAAFSAPAPTEFTSSLRGDLKLNNSTANKEANHCENGYDYEDYDNVNRMNIQSMLFKTYHFSFIISRFLSLSLILK